jgi:aminopeptidase N
LIALPNHPYTGFESLGLIKFRENLMLYSDKENSIQEKQNVALLIANQIAHIVFYFTKTV